MRETVNSITLEYGDALFRIYQFQISHMESQKDTLMHGHRFYELHLAHSGTYTYTVGDRQIPLLPRQMLIIPPDVPHAAVSTPNENYEYTVLSFSLTRQAGKSGFFTYFQNTLQAFSQAPVRIPATLEKRTAELERAELYGAIKGDCYLKIQASSLIYELFEALNGFQTAESTVHRTCDETDRLVLLETLVNQPGRTLGEIAVAINYSPRHTARLIKTIYGQSLSELRKKQTGSP